MEMEARACTGEISGSGEGEGEGEGERERERERNSSGRDTIPEEPSFKSDLLQHYNLRGLYDNAICVDKEPPRKVGKASYFEYSTIAGDGHLRSDPDESNKYDLAPMGEVRQSMQEIKLRPFSTKDIRNAFPLKPGHFELPKVEIGVAIHKKDKKDRDKRLKQQAAETRSKSAMSRETEDVTALTTRI